MDNKTAAESSHSFQTGHTRKHQITAVKSLAVASTFEMN